MDGGKTPVDADAVCRVSPARGVVSTLARVRFADHHFEICYRDRLSFSRPLRSVFSASSALSPEKPLTCTVELPTGPGLDSVGRPPHRPSQPRCHAPAQLTPSPPPCGGVRRSSGVFASAEIWRPRCILSREKCRNDMGDRGRDASLRDTNAARADTRAPRVSSGSPRRNCARHTTDAPLPSPPRPRARSRGAVVFWSVRIQFDRIRVLPIRMSTQFRYNRGAQMTQQRSLFLDKKDRVCVIAARHRPSARPKRRRLAPGIVPASTHHTCGCIPRTHTRFRMSRPPYRARIWTGGGVCGFFLALARVPVHK